MCVLVKLISDISKLTRGMYVLVIRNSDVSKCNQRDVCVGKAGLIYRNAAKWVCVLVNLNSDNISKCHQRDVCFGKAKLSHRNATKGMCVLLHDAIGFETLTALQTSR